MKHFFIITAISCMIVLVIASCTNVTVEEEKTNLEKESLHSLLLEKGTTPITADEAINVARIFDINQGRPQTKAETDFADVYTLNNEEGMPIIYAVNYTDNQGFVLVSASRNYYPILAYSEKGRFDENYHDSGLEVWVYQQENNIRWLNSNITKEQSALFHAAWAPYEATSPIMNLPGTKSGNLIDVRDSLITAWEAQGYSWTSLSERPDGLPASTYNNWCSSAQSIAHTDYDYLENSIIFYKTVVNSHSSAYATVTSEWAQDCPYNLSLPYYANGNQAYAGCATIALGQIMRYHGCPSTYNWNLMPDVCYYSNSTVESFISDLFDDFILSSYYLTGHSSAKPIGTIASILESDYDYDVSYGGHNTSTVMSSLSNGNPVYMSGITPYSMMGHAWVCDGYNQNIYVKTFTLMVLSQVDPPLHYEFLADYTGDAGSTTYYSMNWGEGGNYNGMYLDNAFYPGADYSNSRTDMYLNPLN